MQKKPRTLVNLIHNRRLYLGISTKSTFMILFSVLIVNRKWCQLSIPIYSGNGVNPIPIYLGNGINFLFQFIGVNWE
ncbi:hypothetical protein C2G38_2106465 [Gigaspora rosea]|uniref:Uncharacterized protein n=1 Tax=Gigaspora rosea TaxID=44941 RepID=A0A397UNC8_9GLOM|nr:hypothetical protein C2G38_2106465 [Gigaspora rosea]